MTKFEKLINAYDYLEKKLCKTDKIVDIYNVEDTEIYIAIVISKNHIVYKHVFSCNGYLEIKLLN